MTFGSILFQANSDQKHQKHGKVEYEMVKKIFQLQLMDLGRDGTRHPLPTDVGDEEMTINMMFTVTII